MSEFRERMAWAGGLFEGEGCFTQSWSHGFIRPTAILTMTDEDTVRRFAEYVGFGTVTHKAGRGTYKPQWRWQTTRLEQFQALMAMLWPFLGQRRQARAKELTLQRRAQEPLRQYHPTGDICAKGHPRTLMNASDGSRCRECRRGRGRRYRERKNMAEGYISNAEMDLALAKEFEPLLLESWPVCTPGYGA